MKCFNQKVFFEKKLMEKGFWELILNFNLPKYNIILNTMKKKITIKNKTIN